MRIAIIGAGISGITSAYLLRQKFLTAKIDIYETRKNQIGGNCYDKITKNYYKQYYGPHIFHTSNKEVWEFLNKFSQFEFYQHKVGSYINGNIYKIPVHENEVLINKIDENSFNNAEDYLNKKIGKDFTDKYFKFYSEKQWGIPFNMLPISIVNRIPINKVNEDRYFPNDKYQGIPSNGFTNLCKEIFIKSKSNIFYKKINYSFVKKYDLIILTGRIDEFFDYEFGKLQYRYLKFFFKEYSIKNYQNYSVINYPNDYDFTRITEFNKFLKNKKFKKTLICLEYPTNNFNDEPCYPIFWDDLSQQILKHYKEKYKNVVCIGRLANYQYINIDKAIENTFLKINSL